MKKYAPAVFLTALVAYWVWSQQDKDWPITNDAPVQDAVVAFGDSLTYGQGAQGGQTYPFFLSELIGRPVINEGKNGDTTETALNRLTKALEHNPGMVIITLGGNDLMRRVPLTDTIGNLRTLFSRLQEAGVVVVYAAIEPPVIGDNWGLALRDLCREMGVVHVPHVMQSFWGNEKFMSDNIHPTSAGYKIMAERIHERIKRFF